MAEERPGGYPGALDAERFYARPRELRLLHALLRSLGRGAGRSVAIAGAPGAGKTELLKSWWGEILRGGSILPFFHAFEPGATDAAGVAASLREGFAAQALAFRRRDPSLLARPQDPGALREALASAWGEAAAVIAEAAEGSPGRSPLHEASLLPHRFAAATGTRVLCLYDDFANLARCDPGGTPAWASEAVTSRIAPAVFGGADDVRLSLMLGAGLAAAIEAVRLEPLADDAAAGLLQHLLRVAGAELDGEARAAAVELAGGSPFALGEIARGAAEAAASGPLAVARAYAAAVCRGGLARQTRLRLAEALPERSARATALEVLAFCLRDEGAGDAARLAGRMFKREREIADALAGLERGGFARVDCNLVRVDPDPVMRDCVRALYRRELAGVDPRHVEAEIAAGAVRARRERAGRSGREELREDLRAILLAWDGRQVPASLLDGAAGEGELVTLPRVVAVTSGRIGGRTSPAALDVDALALAWRGEPGDPAAEVAWVARLLPGGPGTARQLEEFEAGVSALQATGDLPAARLVRWAILADPPDPAGARAAAERRLSVSTLERLGEFAALLGVPARLPHPGRPAPAREPGAAFELEMTIPAAAEAESVAARALDQLGENLDFAPGDRARVRAALVEACINAFEHSGVPGGGRVRITFTVAAGDLRIRVENRGRPLAALPGAAPPVGGLPRRRGWGLELIRQLVDEVALEPREDGVSLVMVKHLEGRDGNRG